MQLARPRTPLALLGVVTACSVVARSLHLAEPGETQPGQGFVFDEKYYVNAARVIAGVALRPEDTYYQAAPAGADPNAEHPQLGKLLIAASIRLFGDQPAAWRVTAVIFGTLSILALYWLVRSAGGTPWLALGAAALMSADNLSLVHGRIAVLDVYCLPLAIAGVALWLRDRPVLAGISVGLSACMKLFGMYALGVIVLLQLFRWIRRFAERRSATAPDVRRLRIVALLTCAIVAAGTYLGVLALLDRSVTPYHNGVAVTTQNPLTHTKFMLIDYAQTLKGTTGIASHPWQFWYDVETPNYYVSNTVVRVGGIVVAEHTDIAFVGMIAPAILLFALPALVLAVVWSLRRRDDLSFLVVAWYLATWVPPEWFNWHDDRTTYLYYMVMVLPGVYIAVARLLCSDILGRVAAATLHIIRLRVQPYTARRVVQGITVLGIAVGFWFLYPFRHWPVG